MKRKHKKKHPNVFDGLMTYIGLVEWFKKNNIKEYIVKPGVNIIQLEDNKVIIPPHLERIVSELLKESKQ